MDRGQEKLGPEGFTKTVYLFAQINVWMVLSGLKVGMSTHTCGVSYLPVFVNQVFGRALEPHLKNPRVPQSSLKTTVIVHSLLSKASPETCIQTSTFLSCL